MISPRKQDALLPTFETDRTRTDALQNKQRNCRPQRMNKVNELALCHTVRMTTGAVH
jgi:hypothetical protein